MTTDELRDKMITDSNRLLSHVFVLRIDEETRAIIEAQKDLIQNDPEVVRRVWDRLPPDMKS